MKTDINKNLFDKIWFFINIFTEVNSCQLDISDSYFFVPHSFDLPHLL